MRSLNFMVGDERILMCVKRWRLHYIGAWATIFSFEATLSEEVMTMIFSYEATLSEKIGCKIRVGRNNTEHKETTVCAGHGSPR
jgi:hypothetical protein